MVLGPTDPDPIYDVPRRDEQQDHSENGYLYLGDVVTPRWQNLNPTPGKGTFMDTGKLRIPTD